MSGKEFRLIKELKYSRLTAICAFEPRFLPSSCADHYLICCYFLYGGFFIPTCPEEISVLNVFQNKTVTFVASYPEKLFIVPCPTFLFSKRVRSLVELWIYLKVIPLFCIAHPFCA